MFIHHFKFEICDDLINSSGHTIDSNNEKIALAHELKGIDKFINSLKRAVVLKNRVGNAEIAPEHLTVTAIADETINGDLRGGKNYVFTSSRS